MTVSFGTKTAVKRTRSKAYADISAVYATDELVFVKGLTWMSRFQLGDEPFGEVCRLLEKECPRRFVLPEAARP